MNKIFYFIIIALILVSCKDIEYKPYKHNKYPNAPIEEYFDTIYEISPSIKLISFDQDCNCINTSYVDTMLLLEMYVCKVSDSVNAKQKFKDYIIPLFENLKIKKNYKNYDIFAKDQNYYYVAWINDDFMYYAKIYQDKQEIIGWTHYFKEIK